jgi:hypothetical protein
MKKIKHLKTFSYEETINAVENPNFENTFQSNHIEFHTEILNKVIHNASYNFSIAPFLNTINNIDGSIKHEMAIEASLIYQLTSNHQPTVEIFGNWDYLTHQVIASPFKPIDYMDKMDVFGYKFIQNQNPTISNYLVVEIKKGIIDSQDILQLMKYVDWVKNEYAYGDYSMIKASYDRFWIYGRCYWLNFNQIVERKFIHGVRPSVSAEWKNVKLVSYSFNHKLKIFWILKIKNQLLIMLSCLKVKP